MNPQFEELLKRCKTELGSDSPEHEYVQEWLVKRLAEEQIEVVVIYDNEYPAYPYSVEVKNDEWVIDSFSNFADARGYIIGKGFKYKDDRKYYFRNGTETKNK